MSTIGYAHGYQGLQPACTSLEYLSNYIRGACDFARNCLKTR